jgi:chitinase
VNHGLFQSGMPSPDTFPGYADIATKILNHGFTRYWDKAASAPYLYNSATKVFVSYEDTESLTAKCRYVKEHHLADIMFWDYSSDPSEKLLDTIDTEFRK